MPTPAKIRTAGTLLATATCLLSAGAATSQTQVNNNQAVTADIFATQTLNVVDVDESTSVITPATGNTFTGSAVGVDIDVTSVQSVEANVSASATLNVTGSSGDLTVMSTAANGNSGEGNVFDSGSMEGAFTQSFGAYEVRASAEYVGPNGRTGALSSSTQAIANTQGFGADGSEIIATTVNQSSAGLVQADDGGTLQYTDGTALFSALAASNNVTAVGVSGSTQEYQINQSMTGDRTQAAVFTAAGNAQDITGQATTTANNINVTNEFGDLSVTADQSNSGYVRSQVVLSSYDFGAATASAYGVGNSTLAGNYGQNTFVDNIQNNSGAGIEVIAGFTGDTGYDAYVSATAIGNAVTGYSCSSCPGNLIANNVQTNSAGVGATATTSIATSSRQVQSLSAATGNSATFYVTTPGN